MVTTTETYVTLDTVDLRVIIAERRKYLGELAATADHIEDVDRLTTIAAGFGSAIEQIQSVVIE